MRKLLVASLLLLIFSGIFLLFWYNEWRYSLPTPVPEGYKAVATGGALGIRDQLNLSGNKPVFLHFFNPDCPCSRFNITHFRSLVKEYGHLITFATVVMSGDEHDPADIQKQLGLEIPVISNPKVAAACGVYSTPQAVLITTDEKLYYRGNYNKSRYCTDKASNYAQMAIELLLNKKSNPVFSPVALKAYGCELPDCCVK